MPTIELTAEPQSTIVELENSSWVVERGVRHTEWYVKFGDVWSRAADARDTVATRAANDPELGSHGGDFLVLPPGCQYLCRLRLRLPVGTSVRRRVSTPRQLRRSRARHGESDAVGADLRRDILSFFRHSKPPLAVVETEFRVTRRGLVPAEVWERKRASGLR